MQTINRQPIPILLNLDTPSQLIFVEYYDLIIIIIINNNNDNLFIKKKFLFYQFKLNLEKFPSSFLNFMRTF